MTALVQFTVDRTYMFVNLVKNWSGPVVAVIYAADSDVDRIVWNIETSLVLKERNNVEYHVVYKRQVSYKVQTTII